MHQRETERLENFFLLVHSLDGCDNQPWAKLKHGAQDSISVLSNDWIGRGPSNWAILRCFPKNISKKKKKRERGLALCHTTLNYYLQCQHFYEYWFESQLLNFQFSFLLHAWQRAEGSLSTWALDIHLGQTEVGCSF